MHYNVVRITVGDVVIEGLRTEFNISFDTAVNAVATVDVYNLSRGTQSALVYDALSTIEYYNPAGGYTLLYTGNLRLPQRRMVNGSSITKLSFYLSPLTYNTKLALSLDENCTGIQVWDQFKRAQPNFVYYASQDAVDKLMSLKFPGGYSTKAGLFHDLLNDFFIDHLGPDFTPNYNHSQISIGAIRNNVTTINVENGMVGPPEFSKSLVHPDGKDSEFWVTVTSKLLPRLKMLDRIRVESEYFIVKNTNQFTSGAPVSSPTAVTDSGNGLYIVRSFSHQGDTNSGVFKTVIEAAGVSNE